MQHGSKTMKLAALGIFGLSLATSLLPRAAQAQSATATVDNIDDGDVSDWKAFMGSGGNISHRTSSSRATTGTLSMKLMYAVTTGGYAGLEKILPTPANWSAASALTMSVNGASTGHKFRVQIYETGGERWEYSFPVNFTGWQTVTIPFSSFKRASWQVSGAQVNSIFDRAAHQGRSRSSHRTASESGSVYLDSLAVNGSTTASTPAPAPAPDDDTGRDNHPAVCVSAPGRMGRGGRGQEGVSQGTDHGGGQPEHRPGNRGQLGLHDRDRQAGQRGHQGDRLRAHLVRHAARRRRERRHQDAGARCTRT